MLYLYSIFILIIFSLNLSSEDEIFGYWLTSGSIVKIENCGNSICGEIATIFTEDGVDPKSILDENNKDKSMRMEQKKQFLKILLKKLNIRKYFI